MSDSESEIRKIGSIDVLTLDLFLSKKGRVYLCINEERDDDHLHNVGECIEIGQYGKKKKYLPNKGNLKEAAGLISKHFGENSYKILEDKISNYFKK